MRASLASTSLSGLNSMTNAAKASITANTSKPTPSAVNERLAISRPCANNGTPASTNTSGSTMDSPTCTLR